MRYLPHTPEDIAHMLETVGVESLDGLFSTVPRDCCCRAPLSLPEALTEWELTDLMMSLSKSEAGNHTVFIGAGSYDHHIPAAVSHLLGRSEFVTSYTPYQPEMSQGTLQAIYEYQTLTARLLGMEVANASMYDGASALAEALLMALRITKGKRVAVSRAVHPLYRRVVQTYLKPTGFEIVELPFQEDGRTDVSPLKDLHDLAAVAVQSPNFFGCIEALEPMGPEIHEQGALFVVCFAEPLAYGLLKDPGSLGADIACGEGQSFGIPRSFGGPGLGMFASRMKFVRSMPGRLVGKTVDLEGRDGFVLTLSTREQHIRREKATSNICTNHSLCALTAAMYMASLGRTGLRELARLNHDKCAYLKHELAERGWTMRFSSPVFNEFVVEASPAFEATYGRLIDKKLVAGLPLGPFYPELAHAYLLCVTETAGREDMDRLVEEMSS